MTDNNPPDSRIKSVQASMGGGDRLAGVTSVVRAKNIVFVGASGSGPVIEKIARLSPNSITLIDPGIVKKATLSRMAFRNDQLGQLKVDALKFVIRSTFSVDEGPEVRTYARKVEEVPESAFSDADLLVAGTDDRKAQAYVSRLGVELRIPSIQVGFHDNIEGGHFTWRVPGDGNACYQCGPLGARLSEDIRDEQANLSGVPGCIIDGLQVDLHMARTALAILERGQNTLMGRFYEAIKHKGYAVVSNHPEYAFGKSLMDALLGDLPSQPKAYANELRQYLLTGQVIWMETDADPECAICGKRQKNRRKSP